MNKYRISLKIFVVACLVSSILGDLYAQNSDFDKMLWTVDWSHDGQFFAVGGNHGTLKIYNKKKAKLWKSYPWPGTITAVKWHPSELKLVVLGHGPVHKIGMLDLNTGQLIRLDSINATGARGVDWNHDGQFLAVADNDGRVTIHNSKGEFVRKIEKDNTKSYTGLSWHPTENTFLTVSENIRHYDIDGKLLRKIKHRPNSVLMLCVAWHPSGDFFVTGDYGDTFRKLKPLLQFWNSDGSLRKEIEQSKAEYRSLKWSKNGRQLATASDAIRIWSKNGDLLRERNVENLLWGLDWHPRKKRILTSDEQGIIAFWSKRAKLKKKMDLSKN